VKNWFMAKNGPTERNLVDLIRISDEVLEAVLVMCGREDLVVNNRLLCSRHILIQMLNLIGDLQQVSAQQRLQTPIWKGHAPAIGALDPALGPQIEALKNQVAAMDERLNRIAQALQV
jgi:hypothetical protein